MSVNLSPLAGAGAQFFTDSGTPLTGGLLYTYAAGTTTPATTYSDSGGLTANANPIVLNAAGRVAGEVWLVSGTSYKFVLKTATLTTIGTWDNIDGVNDVAAGTAFYADTFTCTAGQTTFTLTANPGSINNLTVSLDGAVLVAGTDFSWTGTTVVLSMAAYLNQVLRVAYSTAAGVKAISPGSVVDASVAVSSKLYNRIYDTVSVKDFGATGDGSTNDTAAIQAAIASVTTNGGTVRVPAGRYKVTATIYLPSGVNLVGEGYQRPVPTASWEGTSSFYAVHSGSAVLSLKGANGCRVDSVSLEGDVTTHPKVGLCLGRSSAASAGFHDIKRVGVFGYFSQAAIYSIASEENTWTDIYAWLFGGGAKYVFYTSPKDLLSVDTMTQSTNLSNLLTRMSLINSVNDANAACVYMEVGQSMGSWTWVNGYLIPYAGSYIQMNVGTIDGALAPLGPFTFLGTSGERLSGGDPTYGIKLTATTTVTLPGLNIIGSRFDLVAGATHYTISQDANLTLLSPTIVLQPAEAFPYALDSLIRSQILGGVVTTGRGAQWTTATLSGTWANTYGAPYAAAGYCINSNGVVRLRGTIGGGAGAILTLPTGYRPAVNMYFAIYATGGMGRVLINASTGVVSLTAGTATEIDLTSISFNSI